MMPEMLRRGGTFFESGGARLLMCCVSLPGKDVCFKPRLAQMYPWDLLVRKPGAIIECSLVPVHELVKPASSEEPVRS